MNLGPDILTSLSAFSYMIEDALKHGTEIKISREIDSIVVAGMGGSALSGDMLKAYLHEIGSKLPVVVSRDYELPVFVNSKTLIFIISYSGNTEETISSCKEAIRKNCQIIAITTGGMLEKLCRDNNTKLIIIPSGMQPRAGIPYLFFPIINVLLGNGIIKDSKTDFKHLAVLIKESQFQTQAKAIAEKLVGKIPLIYASERLRPAAYIWKISINENAKTHAFSNVFPEMNHNELAGFEGDAGQYHAIFIIDDNDLPRVKKRFGIVKAIVSEKIPISTISVIGESYISKLLSAVYLGGWVSYYLAVQLHKDPTSIPSIDKLKKELAK